MRSKAVSVRGLTFSEEGWPRRKRKSTGKQELDCGLEKVAKVNFFPLRGLG